MDGFAEPKLVLGNLVSQYAFCFMFPNSKIHIRQGETLRMQKAPRVDCDIVPLSRSFVTVLCDNVFWCMLSRNQDGKCAMQTPHNLKWEMCYANNSICMTAREQFYLSRNDIIGYEGLSQIVLSLTSQSPCKFSLMFGQLDALMFDDYSDGDQSNHQRSCAW